LNYYPYLYARQAELKAIETTADRFGSPQTIWPLLEPVDPPAQLQRTLGRMAAVGRGVYLVANPGLGGLGDPAAGLAWEAQLAPQMAALTLRPTFKQWPTTSIADVQAFFAVHANRPTGLILTSDKLDHAALTAAIAGCPVTIFATSGTALALGSSISPTVLVSDNFNAQERNSDYDGIEWLSSTHIGSASTGAPGFSDYTILPAVFKPGGGPVGAAAIHLTFQESDDTFWVQHFISDEIDRNVGNFQSKLLEAITHLQSQIALTANRFTMTPPVATYLGYLATGNATNQSNNKTLQISHHLHMAANYLGLP
jgi:hypothetical protein